MMAAPHLDNPYGAKGGQGGKDDDGNGIGGTGGKADDGKGKDGKGGKVDDGKGKGNSGKGKGKDAEPSGADSGWPKCAHPFCTEPSDPSNFPVGLPWSSGLLKCLPGYCKNHRRESVAEGLASEDLDLETDEFPKIENVCKCKDPPPLACQHKEIDDLMKKGKSKECGKPYPKYIYPDDPCVNQELSFFLRMMMVADEMDRWEEEDRKKEREEAKKKREELKKKREKPKKGEDKKEKGAKPDSKDKKKKKPKTRGKQGKGRDAKPAEKTKSGGETDTDAEDA